MSVTIKEKLGGRKMIVWSILLFVSTALLWFGKIENAQWTQLQMYCTMALLAANAITHFGKLGK